MLLVISFGFKGEIRIKNINNKNVKNKKKLNKLLIFIIIILIFVMILLGPLEAGTKLMKVMYREIFQEKKSIRYSSKA